MRPARFESLLADAARHIPVVDGVKTLADAGHTEHPYGVVTHLRDGGQVWWSFTVQSRSGDRFSEPETPITGDRPEALPMPDFDAGKVQVSAIELALASQLLALDTQGEIKEISRFSERTEAGGAIPYGLRVTFHPGGPDAAKAFVNGLATVSAGQDAPRGRWYEVPATV